MTKIAPSQKECQWAVACHLAAFFGFALVPIGTILLPFCIWTLKRRFHPFIDQAGKESLNFQISMLAWCLLSLSLIYMAIGVALIIGLVAFNVVCIMIASVKASKGLSFHYPLSIRIIR